MTDTPATKPAKTAAAKAAKAFEAPFEAFSFNIPSAEMPAAFRDFAEKSLTGSKEAYAKMKAAAEEATEAFEDTIETARSGAVELGHKSLDAAKQNSDATFAFYKELIGAKTFAEALELQMAFARKQTEALTAQVKDLQDFSQKFVTEATRPVKASVEKAFKGATLN
ncbi:phasin [Mesorhizobium sp. BR1-1-16]|uniref:phasin n=1 Tax=Mesorhizobium sp. BR1-1-16 TaxID=2876653 RepID=UPI001CCF382D|nr:phasin [Mesorhizobium sp. BR1-1-16]MBZ9934675.1 phasin [Mesorhizobium sp. BR1-1-16]HWJ75406.1 phasin [Kaistia sp.]